MVMPALSFILLKRALHCLCLIVDKSAELMTYSRSDLIRRLPLRERLQKSPGWTGQAEAAWVNSKAGIQRSNQAARDEGACSDGFSSIHYSTDPS